MLRVIWIAEDGKVQEDRGEQALRAALKRKSCKLWVDAEDATEEELRVLETTFGLHPADMKDVRETTDIPKAHASENYTFLMLHRIFYRFEDEACELRPFQIFLSTDFLVSIHKSNLSRMFAGVAEHVHADPAGLVKHGPGHILHLLLEGLVNDYRPVLEEWQEKVEEIEQLVLAGSHDPVIDKVLQFKKLALVLRRNFFPQRTIIAQFPERVRSSHLAEELRPFFRHVIDDMSGLMHELDSLSGHAASVFEIYAAVLSLETAKSSHKLNVVMQRLSVVAAVFMPLTFIVGIYGMNIEGIPELHWPGFYYILWAGMVVLVVVMLVVFKRLKWF